MYKMSRIDRNHGMRHTFAALAVALGAIFAATTADARSIESVSRRVTEGKMFLDVTFDAGSEGDNHALYIAYDMEDKGDDIGNWAALQRGCNISFTDTSVAIPVSPLLTEKGYTFCRVFLTTSEAPYDTLIESLRQSGSQYIDTGIYPDGTTVAVMDTKFDSNKTKQQRFFGVSSDKKAVLFNFDVYVNGSGYFASACNDDEGSFKQAVKSFSTDRIRITLSATDGHHITIDNLDRGVQIVHKEHSSTKFQNTSAATLLVFAQHIVGYEDPIPSEKIATGAYLYSFTMTKAGEPVCDYRPCMLGGRAGVYDSVTDRVIYSASGTHFDATNSGSPLACLLLEGEEQVAVAQSATELLSDYVWGGTSANWGGSNAWTKDDESVTWADGNNAVFDVLGATAALDADVMAKRLVFSKDATLSGPATLTVPTVQVNPGVAATISAPTTGALEKTGAGTLTLAANRTNATIVTEGMLKMDGATVAGLTLGTDGGAPVALDYGGQEIESQNSLNYLVTGSNVTLTNGIFSAASGTDLNIRNDTFTMPSVLTIAKDAVVRQSAKGKKVYLNYVNGAATINVIGGMLGNIEGCAEVYLQHKSADGRLDINVLDGGLVYFPCTIYALCGNDTARTSPALCLTVFNSAFVGGTFNFGTSYSNNSYVPTNPTGVFAATNSVISIGDTFKIGRNSQVDGKTGGRYTADFEDCIVTAKTFAVYYDRPLNNARFNGSRFVFNAAGGSIAASDDESNWFTVGDDGLTIDTKDFTATLNANLGGSGAVTKVGAGTLTVSRNQTTTGGFNVSAGALALNPGLTFAGSVSVADGANLDINAANTVNVGSLAFAEGSSLNIASYIGTTPLAVSTDVTLPENGTVSLTLDGGAFGEGVYAIYSNSKVTEEDGAKFNFSAADNLVGEWSVADSTLILTVGEIDPNAWTGRGGDGKMSNGANWGGGIVPVAGSDIDFSGLSVDTAIIADAGRAFGAVTMGTGVITFSGDFSAKSFSDTSKIAVAADSTVTIDSDITLDTGGQRLCKTIAAGGTLHITGSVEISNASGEVKAADIATSDAAGAPGAIVVEGGIAVKTEKNVVWNAKTLALGANGISFTNNSLFYFSVDGAEVYSFGETTVLGTGGKGRFRAKYDDVSLCTTQYGAEQPAVITFDGRFESATGWPGHWRATGGGRVACTAASSGNRGLRVYADATLALTPSSTTIGQNDEHFDVHANATLEVAASGTRILTGDLNLDSGAVLGFNFTGRTTAPVLALSSGKSVVFTEGAATNIVVKVSGAVWPVGGEYQFTTCGGFNADGVTVSLAEGAPKWAKSVYVNTDGNIVLDVKPRGTMVIVR